MYSPKELEGEVDHSFFDSDCDERGNDRGDNSRNINGANNDTSKQVEDEVTELGDIPVIKEKKGNGSVNDDHSRPSSSSSLLSFEEQSEADSRRSDGNPSSHFQITTKIPTGLSAEEKGKDDGEDEDGYRQSEEDSEEDLVQRPPRCKVVHHGLPRKSSGKFKSGKYSPLPRPSQRPPTAVRRALPPICLPRGPPPAHSPVPPPPHRAKLGALARRERPRVPEEESEDTVTDVTPLSTPDISPIQSFELALGKDGERESVIVRQHNVRGGLCVERAHDVGSVSEAFMKLEKKLERELVLESPTRRFRKNYSFSNDEVVRIDRENQRLLRELSRRTPRPKSAALKKPSSPPVRLYHSALNRQREQQRIERENMAFLKRLEMAKPTAGMKRAEQLADYQRQARYLGAAPPPN